MKSLIRNNTQIYFLVFIAIIAIVPFLKNQFIVGPIVNAVLLASVISLGVFQAVFFAVLPSVVSFLSGLLPVSFAFMLPFIAISNILLVTTFGAFYKRGYWKSAILASFLKFFFLFGSVLVFLWANSSNMNANKLLAMFGYLQLFSALMGSLIVGVFRKIF